MDALTDDQKADLEHVFNLVASSPGVPTPGSDPLEPRTISDKELGFLLRAQGVFATESEIRDMISEVDTTGSGRMTYEEFANLMCRSIKVEAEPYEEITDAFDEIGDGTWVSKDDLLAAIKSLGVEITPEEVQEMLAEADVDTNGKISRDDFKFMMEMRHKPLGGK
mmetsp:Transcript_982/g.2169  ORF Transcript_982/g.2169 Transcript_982/m.2169 type:complete len:166 (-) Transcript_982:45-542(-)